MLFLFTLIVCVALAVYGVGLFNALHVRRAACDGAFSRIAVQMQRRYDLLAGLAHIIRPHHGSADASDVDAMRVIHDDAVAALSAATSKLGDDEVMSRLTTADDAVSAEFRRLSSLIEKRPALRADDELALLREELISTDNKIAFARRAYNDAVKDYQARRDRFPGSWLAPLASLRSLAPFVVVQGGALPANVVDTDAPAEGTARELEQAPVAGETP